MSGDAPLGTVTVGLIILTVAVIVLPVSLWRERRKRRKDETYFSIVSDDGWADGEKHDQDDNIL